MARRAPAAVLASSPPSNSIVYAYYHDMESSGYEFRFVRQRNVGVIPTNDNLAQVVVGNAGFTEDPISAHGLTDALRYADLVAVVIARSLSEPSVEAEAMAAYRTTRDHFARALIENTLPLASFRWDGPEASRLLRNLGEIAKDECRLLVTSSIPA